MSTQLTTATTMVAGIISVEGRVALTIGGRREGKYRDRRLLAVAVGEAEVLDRGLVGALGTRGDEAAGTTLGGGVGVELTTAFDTFTHHENTLPRGWLTLHLWDTNGMRIFSKIRPSFSLDGRFDCISLSRRALV